MKKNIVKAYGLTVQLDMLMEECGELIWACSQYKRAAGEGYVIGKTKKEAKEGIIREMAHVTNAMNSVMYLMPIAVEQVMEEIKKSDEQAESRLHAEREKRTNGSHG